MKVNNKIFELIKVNSSNEDYLIGNMLLELFPIDFLRENNSRNDAITICYEKNQENLIAITNAIQEVIRLIVDGKILFKSKSDKKQIGSFSMLGLGYNNFVETTEYTQTYENVWDIIASHYSVPE